MPPEPGRAARCGGLSGASFLAAGSRSVLASLGSVEDGPTRELILRFYSEGGASDPAGALARAQRVAIGRGLSPGIRGPPSCSWGPTGLWTKLLEGGKDMSIRWLAAVLLFPLGFGSAFLVRSQAADAPPGEGTIVGKLRYRDTGTDLQVIRAANDPVSYLVVVATKGNGTPQVAYPNGGLTIPKTDARSVGIYQVIPLAKIRVGTPLPSPLKCRPSYCPLPPEPGPLPGPIGYSYQFLRDPSLLPKPGR